MEPFYRTVIAAAKTVFFLQGNRFTITGAEHVPREGGAIMAINHTAYLDFMYAGLATWPRRRYVRFMAKKSIFGHRVAGPLMRGMHHIPVDRHKGGEAFAAAIRALRDGEIVGVFPEATMSRSFELKEFKPGAVKMAQVAGVPILPVTIWGGQRVWIRDGRGLQARSSTLSALAQGQRPAHRLGRTTLGEFGNGCFRTGPAAGTWHRAGPAHRQGFCLDARAAQPAGQRRRCRL